MAFGGCTDDKPGYNGNKYGNKPKHFSDKADALDEFAQRLKHVYIENKTWWGVVEGYDGTETVHYLDPPYVGSEHRYSTNTFDHRRFYERVCSLEGKVLISYDCIPDWYGDGWQVASKESKYSIDNRDGDSVDINEFLLMNFDSDGEPLMSDVGQQGLDAFGD